MGATPEEELTVAEVADYVGRHLRGEPYSTRTIYNLKHRGVLPADTVRRRRPYWRKSSIDRWLAEQTSGDSVQVPGR